MTITQPIPCAQLTIAELAYELGVSAHFVYLMHAAGFPMAAKVFPESRVPFLVATLPDALEWIDANEFRLVHGVPVKSRGQLRLGLQADFWNVTRNVVKQTERRFAA